MKKKVESDFKKQMNKRLNGRTQPPSSVPKKKNHKKTLFQNKQFKFQQQISKNFLRPGMIISFKYKGVQVHDINPLVLILNNKYMGKLHGINLNYCNYKQIIQIATIVNAKIDSKDLRLQKRFRIKSPYQFYHVQLKPLLRKYKKSIYRTYTLKGVSQQKLMDYNFQATQGVNTLVFTSKDGKIQTKITKQLSPQKLRRLKRKKTQTDTVKTVNINTKQKPAPPMDKALVQKQNASSSNSNVKTVNTKNVKQISSNIVKNVNNK